MLRQVRFEDIARRKKQEEEQSVTQDEVPYKKVRFEYAKTQRKRNRENMFNAKRVTIDMQKQFQAPINADAIVFFGSLSIKSKQDGTVYIGEHINEHFNHKFIPTMFERLKKMTGGIQKFPISQVVMKKDIYKGLTMYGLRFYNYYAGNLQVTRIGFNLREQQMQMLAEEILKHLKQNQGQNQEQG